MAAVPLTESAAAGQVRPAPLSLFAGLKWHLLVSRWRAANGASRAGMIVLLVVVALVLAAAVLGLCLLRRIPDVAPLAISGVFATLLVAWVLGPMIAFGVDETVDPQRFALLPLRTSNLQRGLLVSSLVGYLPIANAVVLVGAAIGMSSNWAVLPLALLCSALQLMTCVVFSRAASTAMASLMSSRRGRDLGMLIGFAVLALYLVLNVVLNSGSGLAGGAAKVAQVLSWTPPGSLASLPYLVTTGQWARVVVAAVIAVAFLAVGWWWWRRALVTSLTRGTSETEGSAPSRGLLNADAVGGSLSGTTRLVAGRVLTLMWRDPMRRMPWLLSLLMAIVWPLLVFRFSGAVYGCALGALLFGTQAGGMYAWEGSGLWLHMVAFGDRTRARAEVLGNLLVVTLPAVLLLMLSVGVVAAIRDDWANVPGALGLCLGLLFGAAGAAAVASAYLPYAMPQSRKSMFVSSVPGQKGRTARATIGTMLGGVVLALPTVVLVILAIAVSPVFGWAALAVAVVSAPIVLVLSSRIAAAKYLNSAPEILQLVSAGDRV
ncbi:hypothetical protein [Nakamurella aerolata]|uniref:ABC-2 type transport system permease protein n=1 Tax=Nakamurella aerolata TaxID=1656892 RepID=A0A849A7V3_9ACTN|nr:hypothetical protein [Nakamurella aerolata]NNG34570.1 hypothetical protein [Nakamurella aerolata]